ncbi:MAG: hypothetical protein LBI39_01235, partial [Puniceicoccales bacterium]|nr:hypothetical protein [Puniceicoccales bacterium]
NQSISGGCVDDNAAKILAADVDALSTLHGKLLQKKQELEDPAKVSPGDSANIDAKIVRAKFAAAIGSIEGGMSKLDENVRDCECSHYAALFDLDWDNGEFCVDHPDYIALILRVASNDYDDDSMKLCSQLAREFLREMSLCGDFAAKKDLLHRCIYLNASAFASVLDVLPETVTANGLSTNDEFWPKRELFSGLGGAVDSLVFFGYKFGCYYVKEGFKPFGCELVRKFADASGGSDDELFADGDAESAFCDGGIMYETCAAECIGNDESTFDVGKVSDLCENGLISTCCYDDEDNWIGGDIALLIAMFSGLREDERCDDACRVLFDGVINRARKHMLEAESTDYGDERLQCDDDHDGQSEDAAKRRKGGSAIKFEFVDDGGDRPCFGSPADLRSAIERDCVVSKVKDAAVDFLDAIYGGDGARRFTKDVRLARDIKFSDMFEAGDIFDPNSGEPKLGEVDRMLLSLLIGEGFFRNRHKQNLFIRLYCFRFNVGGILTEITEVTESGCRASGAMVLLRSFPPFANSDITTAFLRGLIFEGVILRTFHQEIGVGICFAAASMHVIQQQNISVLVRLACKLLATGFFISKVQNRGEAVQLNINWRWVVTKRPAVHFQDMIVRVAADLAARQNRDRYWYSGTAEDNRCCGVALVGALMDIELPKDIFGGDVYHVSYQAPTVDSRHGGAYVEHLVVLFKDGTQRAISVMDTDELSVIRLKLAEMRVGSLCKGRLDTAVAELCEMIAASTNCIFSKGGFADDVFGALGVLDKKSARGSVSRSFSKPEDVFLYCVEALRKNRGGSVLAAGVGHAFSVECIDPLLCEMIQCEDPSPLKLLESVRTRRGGGGVVFARTNDTKDAFLEFHADQNGACWITTSRFTANPECSDSYGTIATCKVTAKSNMWLYGRMALIPIMPMKMPQPKESPKVQPKSLSLWRRIKDYFFAKRVVE